MSRIRLAIMTSGSCLPTSENVKIDSRIRITRNSVPQRWWAVGYLRTSSTVSGSPASSAWIVMCSAPWYWKTRWMSGARDTRARYPRNRPTWMMPSSAGWAQPWVEPDVATLEMNSGSSVKAAMAAANVIRSMTTIEPLPSSTSSSSACTFALRISQRVPMTRVS